MFSMKLRAFKSATQSRYTDAIRHGDAGGLLDLAREALALGFHDLAESCVNAASRLPGLSSPDRSRVERLRDLVVSTPISDEECRELFGDEGASSTPMTASQFADLIGYLSRE